MTRSMGVVMTKTNMKKSDWISLCNLLKTDIGAKNEYIERASQRIKSLEEDSARHYRNAASITASMNRCMEVMEETLNELTDAGHGGRVTKLARYLQFAKYGTDELYQFVNYKEHSENIIKSKYRLDELHKLMNESLKKMGRKPIYPQTEDDD